MKVKQLIQLLQGLNPEQDIFAAIAEANGQIHVEEVIESCDDPTVIGYMITDDPGEETVN